MKSFTSLIVLAAISLTNVAALQLTFYRNTYFNDKLCTLELGNNDFACKNSANDGKLASSANWVGADAPSYSTNGLKKCLCFYSKTDCQGTTRCWEDKHPFYDHPSNYNYDQLNKNVAAYRLNLIDSSKISQCNHLNVL